MTTHECIWKKRKYGNTHTHTVEHVAMHIWGFTFSSVFFFFVSCSSTLLSLFFFFRLGEHSLLVLLSPACCMRFSCQSPYTFLFLLFFFFNKSSAKTGKKKHTHTHICKYIYIQTIDFFLLSLMSKSIHVKRTGSLCAIALGDSAWHFLLQACQRREKKKKIVELCWRLYFRFRSKNAEMYTSYVSLSVFLLLS